MFRIAVSNKPYQNSRPERGRWCNQCGDRLHTERPVITAPVPPVLGRTQRLDEKPTWSLCARCAEERARCAACGRYTGGSTNSDGTLSYCHDCLLYGARCDTCARLVGAQAYYWTRKDGRRMCPPCQSTAVVDSVTVQALYRKVRASVVRELGLSLREPCQLKLAQRKQMMRLLDKSALRHLDAGSRKLCFGLFLSEGRHRAIFLEHGLPRIVLLEVLAHEYAHAWQNDHCPPNAPLEIQEGFSEWVSYKMLQSLGCRKRMARMLKREDIYGQGLKRMLVLESHAGVQGVLAGVQGSAFSLQTL